MDRKEYLRQYRTRQRKQYTERGICHHCGSRPALDNRTRCLQCREIQNLSRKRSKARLREQRMSKRLCVSCGIVSPRDGKAKCSTCLIQQARYEQRRYAREKSAAKAVQPENLPMGAWWVSFEFPELFEQQNHS